MLLVKIGWVTEPEASQWEYNSPHPTSLSSKSYLLLQTCPNDVTSIRCPGSSRPVLMPSSREHLPVLVFSHSLLYPGLPSERLHFSAFCGDALKAFPPWTLILFHRSSRAMYVFMFLSHDRTESLCQMSRLDHHIDTVWARRDKTLGLHSGPYILFIKLALWSVPFKCSRLKLNSFTCIMIICFYTFMYQQKTHK